MSRPRISLTDQLRRRLTIGARWGQAADALALVAARNASHLTGEERTALWLAEDILRALAPHQHAVSLLVEQRATGVVDEVQDLPI